MNDQITQEDVQPDDVQTAAAMLADTFTVTLADGRAFRFKTGTLRQRIAADRIWTDMEKAKSATDVIAQVLPAVTAQLVDPVDLMDQVTMDQLCQLFSAFKHNSDLHLDTKKN